MLNAFRHQRFDTCDRRLASWLDESAQRLSASEIRHAQNYSVCYLTFNVLNAFRHQRFDTHLQITLLQPLSQCSTPFGIRDSTRVETCAKIDRVGSAQRLSASEIRHVRGGAKVAVIIIVLNAFRHQRFDTICPFWVALFFRRAQRLSASEIRHIHRNGNFKKGSMCSTPFGIRDSTQPPPRKQQI